MRPWSAILAATAVLAAAGFALAKPEHMDRLPAATRFACANCHSNAASPSSTDLNRFGEDFKANGFRWDRRLAEMRSDGDNCTNGFELGDQDGDGRLDAGVDRERYNPGELDCTLQINEQAWGALKQLFR